MEEMELSSWTTLDAIRKSKNIEVVETVGNLQTGHYRSVFVIIEDDYLELCYSDSAANYLRRYEDRDEFEEAMEERKADAGESVYDSDKDDEEFEEDEDDKEDDEFEEEEDEDVEDGSDDY